MGYGLSALWDLCNRSVGCTAWRCFCLISYISFHQILKAYIPMFFLIRFTPKITMMAIPFGSIYKIATNPCNPAICEKDTVWVNNYVDIKAGMKLAIRALDSPAI